MKLGIDQLKAKGCSKGLIEVLKLQFKATKTDIRSFDFHDEWYMDVEWDEKTEDKFRKNLKKWIKSHKKLAGDIFTGVGYRDSKGLDLCINMYLLMWGWRTKNG